MTINEAADTFSAFARGFEGDVMNTLGNYRNEIVDIIQEQLSVGLDGNEKKLTPSYMSDPWFQTSDAGIWQGKALQYMMWKEKITPPAPSWLGYPSRDKNTPNLWITGRFYSSIAAQLFSDRLVFVSEGTPMGGDIINKYGKDILKVGDKGVAHIVKYWVKPRMERYFKSFGL